MPHHTVVIVGGGAAGLATAASLKKRRPDLDIAVIEPSDTHFYQPGFTLVGGGVFRPEQCQRTMREIWPRGVERIRAAAAGFDPEGKAVELADGRRVTYDFLVAAPGLKLDWGAIEGLEETLGRNGVTSNYKPGLATYTWQLVRELERGEALFTQPPMPIKCAGAPQKAMYLSADHWRRKGRLGSINVSFCNAGGVLFGVADYVPSLMKYVERYRANLRFNHNLKRIDGEKRIATFTVTEGDQTREVELPFDMIHVVPPQTGLDWVRQSPLANEAGWIEVDQHTLQHVRYPEVFSLGDACSTPNAKTAAAARKQAPIVAVNLLDVMEGREPRARYDGYGSCPLTVERGKIVLAEFGYGGKLMPSFPWDSTKPRRSAWHLKKDFLPWLYWNGMFKGREWMVAPAV